MSDGLTVEVPAAVIEQLVELIASRVLAVLGECEDGRRWPEWMSVETAAGYLDVSPERVRKLVARREIPFSQEAPGCRVFFRRADLDKWMGTLGIGPRET